MYLDFAKKLGLQVHKTKVYTQKINDLKLDIFSIVIAFFLIGDKERKSQFFEKIVLLADVGINIALGILFLP